MLGEDRLSSGLVFDFCTFCSIFWLAALSFCPDCVEWLLFISLLLLSFAPVFPLQCLSFHVFLFLFPLYYPSLGLVFSPFSLAGLFFFSSRLLAATLLESAWEEATLSYFPIILGFPSGSRAFAPAWSHTFLLPGCAMTVLGVASGKEYVTDTAFCVFFFLAF